MDTILAAKLCKNDHRTADKPEVVVDKKEMISSAFDDEIFQKRQMDETMGYGTKMNTFFAKLRFKNKIT